MKIKIQGNGITPEKIAEAIRSSLPRHLTMKSMVIYSQFEDQIGREVSPISEDGREITKSYYFPKPKEIKPPQQPPQIKPEPTDPISVRDMMDLSERAAHRMLSSNEMKILITLAKVQKPERQTFQNALTLSMQQNDRFNVHHLEQLILHQCVND